MSRGWRTVPKLKHNNDNLVMTKESVTRFLDKDSREHLREVLLYNTPVICAQPSDLLPDQEGIDGNEFCQPDNRFLWKTRLLPVL